VRPTRAILSELHREADRVRGCRKGALAYQFEDQVVAIYGAPADFSRRAPFYFGPYYDIASIDKAVASITFIAPQEVPELAEFDGPREGSTGRSCTPRDDAGRLWSVTDRVEFAGLERTIQALFAVSAGDRALTVCADPAGGAGFVVLMRALRSFLQYLLLENGWAPCHAAACIVSGSGVLIPGGKRSGKTTTLALVCREAGSAFISNDNVYLRETGRKVLVAGLPKKISLRQGTVHNTPELAQWLRREWAGIYPNNFIEASSRSNASSSGQEPRSYLVPVEFSKLMRTSLARRAEVQIAIVPSFAEHHRDLQFNRLDDSGVDTCFSENYLECLSDEDSFWREIFNLPSEMLRRRLVGCGRVIVANGGVWRSCYGPGNRRELAICIRDVLQVAAQSNGLESYL
jgi:hypothetical protein